MTKALAPFASKNEITEMQGRLLEAMPGSRKLEPSQAMALAQIALAHGLDPFTGDIWWIPGSGAMIGIKGLRKEASRGIRKEADEAGLAYGSYWGIATRIVDPKTIAAGDEDLAYKYELRDTVSIAAHANSLKRYLDMEMDLDQAIAIVGPAPTVVGYGIYKKGEATKMQPTEAALKRAEAHALKQRFNVEFNIEVGNGDMIEGDFIEQEPRSEEAILADIGIDKPKVQKLPRPVEPDMLRVGLHTRAREWANKDAKAPAKLRQQLAINLSSLFKEQGNTADQKNARHAFTTFIFGVPSTSDIAANEVHALLQWIDMKQDKESEEWIPSMDAVKEAGLAYRHVLKLEGQLELSEAG